jgi:hypothetical protein
LVLVLSFTGITPNSKTSGSLSFSFSASATINPEFSSHFPSLHPSSILSPVCSRLDFLLRDRLTSPLPFHFYRPLQISTRISTWESFAQKMDGQSFPLISLHYTSCTLRLSINGRKGGCSISVSHALERLRGKLPSRTNDCVTADGEVSRLCPCRDFC